jgi:excisionase family DNA binding protein
MSAPRDELSLNEAADQLGVHYMTAYRYVRTGRLPAHKDGAEWKVTAADLERFVDQASAPTSRNRRAPHHERLEERLLAGDEAGAWSIIENALTGGLEADQIHLQLLGPALDSIGERWSAGTITVAQEHLASTVTLRLIGRLGPLFARRGRKRGTVVVGAPPGDRHGIPTAMLGDLLRGRGFEVIDLGADVPADDWAQTAADAQRLVAVGICATTSGNEENIADTIAAIRSAVATSVVLGGSAIADDPATAALGADVFTRSALDALDQVEQLADAGAGRRAARAAGA